MTAYSETVDHQTLARLQAAGAISKTMLVAEPEGWALVVQVRRTLYPLAAKRGGIRHWRRMESAVKYLAAQHITHFQVDAQDYETLKDNTPPRPDAAEKLRRAHEAAAYNRWFADQVNEGLEALEAGRVVPHDQVMAEAEARIEARRREAKGGKA